jgi:hypothetical protein
VTGFRGTDEQLDREIETVERMARVRTRRVAAELRDLERDLRELRRERARRRARSAIPEPADTPMVTVEP